MIATGTDIKPVEIVFFMRNVQSRSFFEQMKGRGVRTISSTEFAGVTPDAKDKLRFVIVDAVGVTESEFSDSYTLDRKKTVSFGKLLDIISMGSREPDVLSSLASRLARLDRQLSASDRKAIESAANGVSLPELISGLIRATDPDAALEVAQQTTGQEEPGEEAVEEARQELLESAAQPFAANPPLRQLLVDIHESYEQTIDTVSADLLIEAGYSDEQAGRLVQSFQEFIRENRDEITALQVLYARPYQQRLRYDDIKELADMLRLPPRAWTTERLWQAYRQLDQTKVRGTGQQRTLADIVSLVRYAVGEEEELVPFDARAYERFEAWMATQEAGGRTFTDEQRRWLEDICDHIAGSVSIEQAAFELAPFNQRGGIARAYTLFGEELTQVLEELNLALAA